jgi:hypothetical protein
MAARTRVPQVPEKLSIREATFHRWRNRYGGMRTDTMKRLQELEKENLAPWARRARFPKVSALQAREAPPCRTFSDRIHYDPNQDGRGPTERIIQNLYSV